MNSNNPNYQSIIEELNVEDPTNLLVKENAVAPSRIKSTFESIFKSIDARAVGVRDKNHLLEIAKPWVTTWTKYGTAVYDQERYYGRIKSETRHTTFLRDVEISQNDLDLMSKAFDCLGDEVPVYKVYCKIGSGTLQYWVELFFTPEAVKMAQVADIMMNISFSHPGEDIQGHFFALPEYEDLLEASSPLELIFIPTQDEAWFFVGGTTYPGDIYKPFCKYLNACVYAQGGAEIHGAGVVISYKDVKTGVTKRKVVVISGLSLHGKTSLSMSDISEEAKEYFANKLGVALSELELDIKLLHDDYLFVKPSADGKYEVGVYAPNGIFPAMIGEKSDNKISSRADAILFNITMDGDEPNFFEPFDFKNWKTGEVVKAQNPRGAAPLKGSFEVDIWESGVVDSFDEFYYITLTRDPAAPSAIKWESISDALLYAAGLVVAPTDATADRADDFYLNYMCTDFDVAPRGPFISRKRNLFENMSKDGICVGCYTINTGAPEKVESLAVRDSIVLDGGIWEENDDLGIRYIKEAVSFEKVYIPWERDVNKNWKEIWENMKERRRKFFEDISLDLNKAGVDDPKALI